MHGWCGVVSGDRVFVLRRGILHYVSIEKRCSARRCGVRRCIVYER